jgi:SNF2 family DNA or RNA helicase
MTIHVSHQTEQIAVPFRDKLAQLCPHAQVLDVDGQKYLVLPHGIDETRLLRSIYDDYPSIPSPIEEHYSFPSADGKRPFRKQLLTSVSMVMNPKSFVLNGMGTGKTKAAIWSFHYLRNIGKGKRMLVVCPLSTTRFTWEREIMDTIPNLRVRVLTGTAERRRRLLAEDADIYIVNHDGAKVIHDDLMKRRDINVICFDEAAAYRNSRADRSKMARQLAQGRDYIWALTGSPTPSAPTDAFGLAHLVVPATAPRSFVRFREDTMLKITEFKWVPKKSAADTVAKVLSPAVRFTLDEIVELPQVVDREVYVEMSPAQKKAYHQFKEEALALLSQGPVEAANAGIAYNKMLQASCGWVYTNDGKVEHLDNTKRMSMLIDIVEGGVDSMRPEAKVIIFSPFISAVEGIEQALIKAKIKYANVSGRTPHGQRSEIFKQFQHGSELQVLNAHPECMSHGLTLTAADTIIWFGPTMKLETFEQANARITRIGQTKKQQIIKFISSQAEHQAYQRLAARQDLQMNVLDIIAGLTAE